MEGDVGSRGMIERMIQHKFESIDKFQGKRYVVEAHAFEKNQYLSTGNLDMKSRCNNAW